MGLFENVVHRVQLTGEALLVSREIKARKQLFGVECFDLLRTTRQKSRMNFFMHIIDVSGAENFLQCEEDIHQLEEQKIAKEVKLNELEEGQGSRPGNWIVVERMHRELSSLERKIRTRKERFGLEFFDSIRTASYNDGPIRMKVSKAKGFALMNCIQRVRIDVWALENRQQLRDEDACLGEC